MSTTTLRERLWHALHCLPRDEQGRAPSLSSIERKADLPNAFLRKLLNGITDERRITVETVHRIVPCFTIVTTYDWLIRGLGEAPPLSGPMRDIDEVYPIGEKGDNND